MGTLILNKYFFSMVLMFSLAQYVGAAVIVTTDKDESVLESIKGFDAGPLGIVDMDFAGDTFNAAFGTDPKPKGYLFSETYDEAFAIASRIQALLTDYNSKTDTRIRWVMNQNPEAEREKPSYLDVAYNVTPTIAGNLLISSTAGRDEWSDPFQESNFHRDHTYFNYARMTRAKGIPEPGALALLAIGFCVFGVIRIRCKI